LLWPVEQANACFPLLFIFSLHSDMFVHRLAVFTLQVKCVLYAQVRDAGAL